MNISSSIRRLANLFILLFVALSGSLVYWQVVVAQDVTNNDYNGRSCLPENAPIRGRILDRNGVVLAETIKDEAGACGYQRKYHEDSLAGLIGYYAGPTNAITGIEKEFDDYLAGRVEAGTLDNTLNRILHRPPIGYDIYLTIDVRIQQLVDDAYDGPDSQYPNGSIVVSDPQTGEVLAMLSRPKFDPNRLVQTLADGDASYYNELANDPSQPLLFRPLYGRYVPGSTYKAVTLMAGLDAGVITLDTPYTEQEAKGPVVIGGTTFDKGNNIPTDSQGNYLRTTYPISVDYAFSISNNIIFADIGANKVGPEKWLEFNKRFYIGEEIPFDLPVTPSQVLFIDPDTGEYSPTLEVNQTAENAFGQGATFMTPFQMSLFDNAAANNGALMRPTLVQKITDHNGQELRSFSPQVLRQVMGQDAAIETRKAMYGMLLCGLGQFGPDKFWSVGDSAVIGKTGTAEIDGIQSPHGWLLTQGPYNPSRPEAPTELTIVSMKENSAGGASVNAPLLEQIYNEIFTQGYVEADVPALPINNNYCVQNDLYSH